MEALAGLCAACLPQPWSAASFASEREKGSLLLTAWENATLIGFAVAEKQDDAAYLHLIGVAPSCRRTGVGRELMSRYEAWSRSVGADRLLLDVRVSNETAQALYRALGFEILTRRRGFYSYPREDGLTMQKGISYENSCH